MDSKIKPPIFLIEKNNFLAKKRIISLSNFTNLSTSNSPNKKYLKENSIISSSESSNDQFVNSFNISSNNKPIVKKMKWSEYEDNLLIKCVNKYGVGKWNEMERCFNGRTRKQIRQRYISNIKLKSKQEKKDQNISLNSSTSSDIENKENIKKKENNNFIWTEEYDKILLKEYFLNKKSWVKISKKIPGSSENSVKNRFYSLLRQIANKTKKIYKHNFNIDSSTSINEKDNNNIFFIKNKEIYRNIIPLKSNTIDINDRNKMLFCDIYNNSDFINNKSKKKKLFIRNTFRIST